MAPVILLSLLLAFTVGVGEAQAHTGKVDDLGCHKDRQSGYYHCHEGALAGRKFARKTGAKRALKKLEIEAAVLKAATRVVVPLSPVVGAPDLFGPYRVTLVRVADEGVELDIHLWPGLVQRAMVGLVGVYGPRLSGAKCEAKAAIKARAFTADWLGDGTELTVDQVQRDAASGQMQVHLSKDGNDLGAALVAAGHGREGDAAPWCVP